MIGLNAWKTGWVLELKTHGDEQTKDYRSPEAEGLARKAKAYGANRRPEASNRMTLAESIPAATMVALGIGGLAKQWQAFPDRYIPTLVAVVGAVIVPALAGYSAQNLVAGLSAGLAATGANQALRQIQKNQ